ncbi:hypothetical protein GGR57DRAFT_466604 [Xylariaceae sp. FL1272]|nr:hypothetical protein GGR57DRAFT_466604 [Xylariaceae sp. FL1272]
MLILNNIHVQVNTIQHTFDSVTSAWTMALTAMENLVQGIHQRVTNGATLLAIWSWHLYPDMHVLTSEVKSISQGDELMVGATLTLSTRDSEESWGGVFWSLPLSRMRYYSPPVVVERQVASDTSCVSLDAFRVVCLGALIAKWIGKCPSVNTCCEVVLRILEESGSSPKGPKWCAVFRKAAKDYIISQGTQRERYHQLLNQGIRRSGAFLGSAFTQSIPFFWIM